MSREALLPAWKHRVAVRASAFAANPVDAAALKLADKEWINAVQAVHGGVELVYKRRLDHPQCSDCVLGNGDTFTAEDA